MSAFATAMAVAAVALAAPAAADASPRQFTILQDDAVLLGLSPHGADEAMDEARRLGVDMVRAFVTWQRVSPRPRSRLKPAGFDVSDPDSPGYDWSVYDAFVERARRSGLDVMLTLSPPIPYWASEEPRRCPHFVGGYRDLSRNCFWKPRPQLFGQFAAAVAKRYGSRAVGPYGGRIVSLYSIWNEPNLEHYLYPQLRHTRHGIVDVAARRYRELWLAGWRAIARHDPDRRGRVLFGETAAISSPLDTLYASLCLDEDGRPFRGSLRRLQGCRGPRKLPIGGFAIHPYNKDASGTVFQRSRSSDSLPMAHLPRLHRLMDVAARHRRIPRGRGIYITEFGFQSKPPDRVRGLRLRRHAREINHSERLFFADRRIRSIAQFELFDVPEPKDHDVYNTGLRLSSGRRKPAWAAFRMPLVATRLGRGAVELWGHVRPAGRPVRVRVTASRAGRRGRGRMLVARPLTSFAGHFKIRLRLRDAARRRYVSSWRSSSGELMRSRVARPGRKIRYSRR